ARQALARWLSTPAGFFLAVVVFAVVMSWGPAIAAKGRPIASASLYRIAYDFVPGFDGVRAPARFAMVVSFGLAVLAGLGVKGLAGRVRLAPLTAAASVLILAESFAAPIPINQNSVVYNQPGLAPLPPTIWPVPSVYDAVASLPNDAAIVELPL